MSFLLHILSLSQEAEQPPIFLRQQQQNPLSIKRQASCNDLSTQASNKPKRDYLTVSPPAALTLKPSLSSPTTTTTSGKSNSNHCRNNNNNNSPTSPEQSPISYSPYCDSGFNLSTSSLSSVNSSLLLPPPPISSNASTTTTEEEESLPSTPPLAPCFYNESKRSSKDIYGFKQPTQWINLDEQLEFERYYQPILERQKQKWASLLDEHQGQFPPVDDRLIRYVRKGIPQHLRGKAWMHYSGAQAKMEANAGLYQHLVKTAELMGEHNEYAEIIHRDLHRTFPDNDHFSCAVVGSDGSVTMDPDSNPKLRALRRVLLAFSVYAPQIGYCQSLNYLAGFFLLFVGEEEGGEEAAFWMLITTVHDYFPENMYDVTMEGAHIDQSLLMLMVYERMPEVWNKIGGGKDFWECIESEGLPPVTLVTSHWFLTMFINILPVETVLRVWDCLFVEGSKVLFSVALTIIKMSEKQIWSLDDPIEMFPVLQNIPRRLVNCHRFIECVFSSKGIAADITTEDIESNRVLFRERRKQKRAPKKVSSPSPATEEDNFFKKFYFLG